MNPTRHAPVYVRVISVHQLDELNRALKILALTPNGPGGAPLAYAVLIQPPADQVDLSLEVPRHVTDYGPVGDNDGLVVHRSLAGWLYLTEHAHVGNPLAGERFEHFAVGLPGSVVFKFHRGPIDNPSGLTHEVLLTILADRLSSFQAGKFACPHNATALTHVAEAHHTLVARTTERVTRGVLGQPTP